MEITFYELLGMIKDGNGPMEFIWKGLYWHKSGDYYFACNRERMLNYFQITDLSTKVRILDNK